MNFKLILTAVLFCLTATAQENSEPWKPTEIVAPEKLAAELKTPDASRHILYVGFPIMYKGAHIPGAQFAGPCSTPEGLALLAKQLKGIPRDAEVILYCGCCPFSRCPNIRPAYQQLSKLGYSHIKVLKLDTNLHTDWVEKAYSVERSDK